MKIAIVAQHANPCTRAPARARARTTPDSASSPASSPGRRHRVTVYAQKLSRTCRIAPNSAAACASCASRSARSASGVTRNYGPTYLRARWRRELPDVVHAISWTSGLAAGHRPTPTVFAGAVTKTARLLANKGPQSTYVRNS
jgi:hypothetical protein